MSKRKNYGMLFDVFEGTATISWFVLVVFLITCMWWDALIALAIAVPCEYIAQRIKTLKKEGVQARMMYASIKRDKVLDITEEDDIRPCGDWLTDETSAAYIKGEYTHIKCEDVVHACWIQDGKVQIGGEVSHD